MEDEEVGKRI